MNNRAFSEQQCQDMIKDALYDMGNDGYDFHYSCEEHFGGRPMQMFRHMVYMRFNCQNCQQIDGGDRRFTTSHGTVRIRFKFKKLNKKHKYRKLLIFRLRILGMKCIKCGTYGIEEIYQDQMQKIIRQFCVIVRAIIRGDPRGERRQIIQGNDHRLVNHMHSLCEACKLNLCHQGPCPRPQQ